MQSRTPRPALVSAFIRRHPLISFFVLAFAFTWAIMIPLILSSYGLVPFPNSIPLLILMGYGPTLAALVVTAALGGWSAIRGLLGRLLIWRVGWIWYAVAILLNGAMILSALGLYALLGNSLPPFPTLEPELLLNIVLTLLIVGLVNGEEIGWRGFALPRLLERWGVAGTVLVLGTLETLYHLPIFFNNGASDAGGQNGTPILAFAISSFAAVFLLTWVYQNTRGSLLLAYLFHASMNMWTNILPFPSTSPSFFWLLALAGLVASAIVLVVSKPDWMKRTTQGMSPVAHAMPSTGSI